MPRLLLAAAVALLVFVPLALARVTNTVAITGGPSGTVNTKDASFTFSSTGAITNFKCSLDGGAANDCTSPTSYTGLGDGGHTFALQGFRSSTGPLASQTRSWSIDATPPDTTITSQIPAWIKSTDLAIAFSSGEQASFRCRLDGGAWTDCGSPFNLTGLAQGSHSFDVVAADAAGNVDPSPASASWRVDTVAPETTITPVPEFTKLSSLHVAFDANEPQVTFECRLDVGAYSSCSSPKTLSALAQGTHTLQVYAADQAGNSDASPATETWIVDTTPPVAALVLPVGAFQFEKQFTVSWKGGDAHSGIARYDVRVRSAQALGSFPKTPNQAFIYASWKAGTTIVGSAFSGQPGYTYCFDVRAVLCVRVRGSGRIAEAVEHRLSAGGPLPHLRLDPPLYRPGQRALGSVRPGDQAEQAGERGHEANDLRREDEDQAAKARRQAAVGATADRRPHDQPGVRSGRTRRGRADSVELSPDVVA